jgi:acyl phosphate:glycerol-3-phosphate acyltransferase
MPRPISWAFVWPYFLAAFGFGYLIGAIPFGLLLTRFAGLGDIRTIGSGNIGATNVLRTGRKSLALATLLLDGAKGTAAVLIAFQWGPDMALAAAAGVMLGHVFPVWLGFKGGKGVATAFGVLLALAWPVGIAGLLTWLATAALTRYSSLAALVALAASPAWSWFLAGDLQLVEFTLALAVLVWATHYPNIRRLLTGNEPKIGTKA